MTQLVQITSQIVFTRSLFKLENHTLVRRYFMSVFYLGDKDGLDVQQLRSNVLAVDATLSQAPSAKDLPVPGRSAVACSEPSKDKDPIKWFSTKVNTAGSSASSGRRPKRRLVCEHHPGHDD